MFMRNSILHNILWLTGYLFFRAFADAGDESRSFLGYSSLFLAPQKSQIIVQKLSTRRHSRSRNDWSLAHYSAPRRRAATKNRAGQIWKSRPANRGCRTGVVSSFEEQGLMPPLPQNLARCSCNEGYDDLFILRLPQASKGCSRRPVRVRGGRRFSRNPR